jgi:hypothetical protein
MHHIMRIIEDRALLAALFPPSTLTKRKTKY